MTVSPIMLKATSEGKPVLNLSIVSSDGRSIGIIELFETRYIKLSVLASPSLLT